MSVRNLKQSLVGAAGAAAMVFGFASGASADTIGFDLDGAAAAFSKVAATKFALLATQAYNVDINLAAASGGANTFLSNGDTFTETLRLNLEHTRNFSTDSNNNAPNIYDNGANSFSYIDVALTGHIQGCNPNCSTVTDSNPLGTPPKSANFDVVFDTGSAEWWYDPNASHLNPAFSSTAGDTSIATFSVLSGGATDFTLENGTSTSHFGVTLKFNTPIAPTGTWFGCTPVFTDLATDCTNELSDEIALNLVFALADASVNIQNIQGSPPALPNHILLTVGDNGTTVQASLVALPEPTTLLLFGTGLLGLGMMSRRKRKAA